MVSDRIPYSCDTLVVTDDATAGNRVLFGKNSDRPAWECQPVVLEERAEHDPDETLSLAYREIPQVRETYRTLGTAPYWCWGYELGVNEHDVAIGNEGLFTAPLREQLDGTATPDRGIIGMEFVRLGLERARTAGEAVDVIGDLLETYGQFGSAIAASDDADGAYDNSYLVADPDEAWVLETAGRVWTARRIDGDAASISNEITTRDDWDRGSGNVEAHAVERGWWPADAAGFDFAQAYSDHETPLQVSHVRYRRTQELLDRHTQDGAFDDPDMRRILRDHYEDSFLGGPKFNAALPDFLTVCMHSSPAEFTWGNTVSSAVFELPTDDEGITTLWWTPGPPCVGVYVPLYPLGEALPDVLTRGGTVGRTVSRPASTPEDEFSADSYWWRFKRLLAAVKGDDHGRAFTENRRIVRDRFDALEAQFRAEADSVEADARQSLRKERPDEAATVLSSFTEDCVASVLSVTEELLDELETPA